MKVIVAGAVYAGTLAVNRLRRVTPIVRRDGTARRAYFAGRAAAVTKEGVARGTLDTGDPQGLLDVLAPDVVMVGDGGGLEQAALRPVTGAEKVARYVLAVRVEGARITGLYCVRNPEKLTRVESESSLNLR